MTGTAAPVERLQIAKITDTQLGYQDHGILSADLTVDFGSGGGGSMGVGGYGLGSKTTAFGMQFVKGILDACGVRRWEDLKGRTVYVVLDSADEFGGRVIGIQNLPTEPGTRFIFAELKAKLAAEVASA